MKKRAIVWGLSVLAVAGSFFVEASQGSVSVSGDAAAPVPQATKVDGNDPAIQAIVREEVAKQLQPAVQKEVRRQLDAILYRAQQEQIARSQVQEKAMRANSMRSTLQTLRSQLELYKIQHADVPPKLAEMQDWRALLQKTNTTGGYEGKAQFGPYLSNAPVNAFNNQTAIVPTGRASMDAGWTYNDKTGELRVIVPAAAAREFGDRSSDDIEVVK